MTFFNFTPDIVGQSGQPRVSDRFWIYWAVTTPITVVVLIAWFVWQLAAARRARQDNVVAVEVPLQRPQLDLESKNTYLSF